MCSYAVTKRGTVSLNITTTTFSIAGDNKETIYGSTDDNSGEDENL
jgi:hypothetical protein